MLAEVVPDPGLLGTASSAHSTAVFEGCMIARIEAYLSQFIYDSAIFLCERLVAELPTESSLYLLARCYHASNQPQRVYHLLKDAAHIPSRFLFATVCVTLNRLVEAETALSSGSGQHSVIHGAAGLYLMGRVHVLSDRHTSAIVYFQAALRADPMLWGAFEALCALGASVEAQAYVDADGPDYPGTGTAHAETAEAPYRGAAGCGGRPAASTGITSRLRTTLDLASPDTAESAMMTPVLSQESAAMSATPQCLPSEFSFAADLGGGQTAAATPAVSTVPSSCGLEPRPGSPRRGSMPSYITPSPAAVMAAPMAVRKAAPGRAGWPRHHPLPQPARRESKLRRLFESEEPQHPARGAAEEARIPGPGGGEAAQTREAARSFSPRRGPLALLRALGGGLLHLAMYRCVEAVEAFRALPERQYRTGWVLVQVGRALAEGVRYRESAAAFAEARALDPSLLRGMEVYSTVLWHLKRAPELSALAQAALALDRLHPSTWCAVGNCFSLQRDHATALRFLRRAIQLDATQAYAHTLAGHELRALDAYDGALAAYRAALRADPRHYNAWYGLGAVYLRLEKHAMAEHHFRRAAALHPTSSVLVCYLGIALGRLGRADEALAALERAVELDPANPLARFEAAACLLAADRPRDALAQLERLHESAPRDATTLLQMGKLHRRLGDADAALRCFCAALDLRPPAATADLIKAAVERLRGDAIAVDDEDDDDI